MERQGLTFLIETMEDRHARIEHEEIIERETRCPVENKTASGCFVSGIADWGERAKAVKGTAQIDEYEPLISRWTSGRDSRRVGPSEECAGNFQRVASRHLVGHHGHLR